MTLPRFQRFEAWSHHQVTALLDTVLNELPAGAVLVLEIGDQEPFVSRPMKGAPSKGERVSEQLLDGQQRLTALWRSLTANYSDRSYLVCVDDETSEVDTPFIVSYSRYKKAKSDELYPIWLNNPEKIWQRGMVPVELLRPDTEAENELDEWAQEAANDDRQIERKIIKIGNHLRQLFAKFNIPFLSLPSTTPVETALNVFIQMNTSASPLSAYDIVVAQVEAAAEASLHEMADDLRASTPSLEAYIEPSDLMLAVSALLQDKTPSRSTYLSSGFSQGLVDEWSRISKGISAAVQFLEDENIYDAKRLPSDVVLYPLAALWAIAPEGLDSEGQTRTILRKYLWRSFFTNRYERTSATRALVDFRQIKALILTDDSSTPLIFDEEEYPLPEIEEIIAAGWPVRKDRLARALLAIALRAGGYDFADGRPATRDNLKAREYHHLFPDSWLKKNGLTERETYRSLNCGLVTWKTNRNISAKAPSIYIEERMQGNSLGRTEIERRLKSHLIPTDALLSDHYQEFLNERAAMMMPMIRKLCDGESI